VKVNAVESLQKQSNTEQRTATTEEAELLEPTSATCDASHNSVKLEDDISTNGTIQQTTEGALFQIWWHH